MAEEKNIKQDNLVPIQDEIVLYQSEDGNIKVDVLFQDETVWLTQEQIAQLFGKGRTTITEHIGNIFKEGELDEEKVCRKFRHTTQHAVIEGLSQTQEVSTGIVEKVRKQDILVGKNYLNEDELKALKLIVEQYLAYAESQTLAHRLLVIGNNDNYFENQ